LLEIRIRNLLEKLSFFIEPPAVLLFGFGCHARFNVLPMIKQAYDGAGYLNGLTLDATSVS
jgi:hypothetical protein